MKRLNLLLALAFCSVSSLAGCSDSTPAMKKSMDESGKAEEYAEPMSDSTSPESKTDMKVGMFTPTILDNGEASHITVQHVLIAFKGSVPGKNISRSKTEAETLAKEILAKAVAGEDFDALVKTHTDDSPPGIYNMANFNQQEDMGNANAANKVFPRGGMVGAFGNVGFPLKVGEVGLAEYDPTESKYGWHIIKRLK